MADHPEAPAPKGVGSQARAQRLGEAPAPGPGSATEILEEARLDGARLAFRTIRHLIATRLAVVVGHAELLADDPRLAHDLHTRAQQIAAAGLSAAAVMRRLDEDLIGLRMDKTVAGPSLLDVERSTH